MIMNVLYTEYKCREAVYLFSSCLVVISISLTIQETMVLKFGHENILSKYSGFIVVSTYN